jgi:hypothetical protein
MSENAEVNWRAIAQNAFLWYTGRGQKPSGRAWGLPTGISHTWLQKLVRQFQADPTEMYGKVRRLGDPNFAQLSRAREQTWMMGERGELRGSRLAKVAKFFERY